MIIARDCDVPLDQVCARANDGQLAVILAVPFAAIDGVTEDLNVPGMPANGHGRGRSARLQQNVFRRGGLRAAFVIDTEHSRSRTSARLMPDLARHVPGRALSMIRERTPLIIALSVRPRR